MYLMLCLHVWLTTSRSIKTYFFQISIGRSINICSYRLTNLNAAYKWKQICTLVTERLTAFPMDNTTTIWISIKDGTLQTDYTYQPPLSNNKLWVILRQIYCVYEPSIQYIFPIPWNTVTPRTAFSRTMRFSNKTGQPYWFRCNALQPGLFPLSMKVFRTWTSRFWTRNTTQFHSFRKVIHLMYFSVS